MSDPQDAPKKDAATPESATDEARTEAAAPASTDVDSSTKSSGSTPPPPEEGVKGEAPRASGATSESKPEEGSEDAGSVEAPAQDAAASGEPTTDGSAEAEADVAAATEGEAPDAAPETAAAKKAADPDAPKGNPLRLRALSSLLTGVLGLFFLMAKNAQWRLGVPLGVVFAAVATFGVMDLLGTFDDAEERVVHRTDLGKVALPLGATLGSFLLFAVSLWAAQANTFGTQWGWGVVVTLVFVGFVASLFQLGVVVGPFAKDELGEERPLHKRHGFWVVLVGALLYFPAMGVFSLWDPWETHYGEVAREILARDDWISLWWAQDGWFWSKPILNFWIQSLSMASLGTHYQPDQMMMNGVAHPEWVVRTPNVLMTILAQYAIYKGVAKVFGRRAGLLGGLALATMPDWFFLAHQTMTDMPFVSAMTAAMGMLLLGLNTSEEAKARLYEVEAFGRKVRFSGFHLIFGVILLCAIPQIVYLLTRNVELVVYGSGPKGFRFHYDEFKGGSGGNCGLPGNEACHAATPASIPRGIPAIPNNKGQAIARFFGALEPAVQGLVWTAMISGLLYLNWGERRTRRLFYIGAWFFAAIATMGKGPAGFILPGVCAFAYVATKKRWSELTKLELWSGLLVIATVAAPWFVAMYIRHGSPFTDRLFFHDMFNRAFSHVHDTNEGDDTSVRFYLWQLGYALFPWTGLVPLGLAYWLRRSDSADEGRGDASIFLVMWFVFAFALFTFMGTKFHHYIFPAVPPAAMLVGVVLDDALKRTGTFQKDRVIPYGAGLLVGAALLVYGVARHFPGSVFGTKLGPQQTELLESAAWVGRAAIAAGVLVVGATIAFFHRASTESESSVLGEVKRVEKSPYRGGITAAEEDEATARAPHEALMIAGAAVGGAMLLVLIGRDLGTKPIGADQPGAIRLLQLFTYNYRRAWPDNLDFGAVLKGFSMVGIAVLLLFAIKRLRGHAIALFTALAFVFALWGEDVYMVKTAPHWGQHEVIEAYYRGRAKPDEPLVAYQMNWKGENFYTSNRIPAFVSSGAPFTKWIKDQRDKGINTMFFVTEHGRTGGLRSEVGTAKFTELTDKNVCNKFVLIKAEF